MELSSQTFPSLNLFEFFRIVLKDQILPATDYCHYLMLQLESKSAAVDLQSRMPDK